MAEDYSSLIPPIVRRVTLSSTPDDLTEVQLPEMATKVSFQFVTNDGKFTFEGTDAAAIGSHYGSIAADSWMEIPMRGRNPGARTSIYFASATASTVVEIHLDEDN